MSVPGVDATCASCSHPLSGRYCPQCGERALDPHDLTVRHFLHTVLHEVSHLDGKIWRTFGRLMLRPSFLTAEYCAGRRRLYVNPVRVFITAVLAYALFTTGGGRTTLKVGPLVLSLAPVEVSERGSIADGVQRLDRFGVLARMADARGRSVDLADKATVAKFHARLKAFSEPLSFANVLLFTLALQLAFYWRRPLLVAQGVFSMHFMSFVLLSSFAFTLVGRLVRINQTLGLLVLFVIILWQFAYLAVALRRFYMPPRLKALWAWPVATAAAIVLNILNSAFITGVQVVGGALALWTL